MKKQLLFSVTAKDCRWDYYRGSGAGGQKRNKTSNCCRCTHLDSGAVGTGESGRSKEQNKQLAFRKMAQSEKFKQWQKMEVLRITGELNKIEQKVEAELADPEKTKVEIWKDGKWTN